MIRITWKLLSNMEGAVFVAYRVFQGMDKAHLCLIKLASQASRMHHSAASSSGPAEDLRLNGALRSFLSTRIRCKVSSKEAFETFRLCARLF